MRFLIELSICLVIVIAILTVLGLIICFIENIFNKNKKQKTDIVGKIIPKCNLAYEIKSIPNTKNFESLSKPNFAKNNKATTKSSNLIKKENKEETKNATYITDSSYLTNDTSSQIITDCSSIITDCSSIITDCSTSFDF